jgi:hypothetical protein
MRSLRRLVVVGAAIALLAVLVPSASAASQKAFHLEKTCVSHFLCTVQWSDFKAIPPGTDITYVTGASAGLMNPTIVVRNGSTTGVCDWNQPAGPVLAICTLGTGTGRLTQFHLVVKVTTNPITGVWYWDGTYWFGGGN